MDVNYIVAIVLGVIAAAPGVWALVQQARKDKRALPQSEISAGLDASLKAADLVAKYTSQIDTMQRQIKDLRAEMQDIIEEMDEIRTAKEEQDNIIEEWRVGIEKLINQIIGLKAEPVWKPTTVHTIVRKGPNHK